jgi:three-Cys-motif partner protein
VVGAHGLQHGIAQWPSARAVVVDVDGFASAGRYQDGRTGSPPIFLQSYLQHDAHERFRSPPHFVLIESKRSFAMHLQHEVNGIGDLQGAHVDVGHAEYEDASPDVVNWLACHYRAPLPTFAFVTALPGRGAISLRRVLDEFGPG